MMINCHTYNARRHGCPDSIPILFGTHPTPRRLARQRANALVKQNRRLLPGRDDAATIDAAHYLRLVRRNPRRAATEFAAVHAACGVHGGPVQTRDELEARILARCSSSEIACVMGIDVQIVDTYESVFFACRDHLEARDWIAIAAIGRLNEPDVGSLVKRFAYFGGPFVLEAVLEGLRRRGHGGSVDAHDPVLLAFDAMLIPDDELKFSRLTRLLLELRSNSMDASEKAVSDARKLRQPGLSPSELAREMRPTGSSQPRIESACGR